MSEKKSKKHRQLLVNMAFESNRFEEESMISAYELVLPSQKKSSVLSRKKTVKQSDKVHQEQLHIAL